MYYSYWCSMDLKEQQFPTQYFSLDTEQLAMYTCLHIIVLHSVHALCQCHVCVLSPLKLGYLTNQISQGCLDSCDTPSCLKPSSCGHPFLLESLDCKECAEDVFHRLTFDSDSPKISIIRLRQQKGSASQGRATGSCDNKGCDFSSMAQLQQKS